MTPVPEYQRRFGDRLVIIDGNNFVTNPGEELRKIEQKFSDKESWFLKPERFKKRDDGHYEGIKKILVFNGGGVQLLVQKSYSMGTIMNPNKVHKDCSKINLLSSKIKGSQWKSTTDVRFNQENARGRF